MRSVTWAVALPLALLVVCWVHAVSPAELFRYRMSVTVEDNGRLITAQSVRQYSSRPPRLGGFQVGNSSDIGDSVILPVRGKLLVVTHGRWFNGSATCVGARSARGEACTALLADWIPPRAVKTARGGQAVELAPFEYPIIVTFEGLPDVQTVTAVDPTDLGRQFGEGVRIRDITVTRTVAFLSRSQHEQLPFVKTLSGTLSCHYGDAQSGPWSTQNQRVNPSLGSCITAGFF